MPAIRLVILSFCAVLLVFIGGCGQMGGNGGGADGSGEIPWAEEVIRMIPAGSYYRIEALNLTEMYSSGFFREPLTDSEIIEDFPESHINWAEDLGVKPEQFSKAIYFLSTDVKEALTFYGGPYKTEGLANYCQDILLWEGIEKKEYRGGEYWSGDNGRGFIQVSGGVLFGREETIKRAIEVAESGEGLFAETDRFKNSNSLVDLDATTAVLNLGLLHFGKEIIEYAFLQEGADEEVIDAVNDLIAEGYSERYQDDLELISRFIFTKEFSAEQFERFWREHKQVTFRMSTPRELGRLRYEEEKYDEWIKYMSNFVNINRSGPSVEVRYSCSPDDLKRLRADSEGERESEKEVSDSEPPAEAVEVNEDISLEDMYKRGCDALKSKNYAVALQFLRKSGEKGYFLSQWVLAQMFDFGNGVAVDYSEALAWYRKAAEGGNSHAMYVLAERNAWGRGIPLDFESALELYKTAADLGDSGAALRLGQLYESGRWVHLDVNKAIDYYLSSAEKWNVEAMYRLGRIYERGMGLPVDLESAKEWYRKAADRYYGPAEEALQRLRGKENEQNR